MATPNMSLTLPTVGVTVGPTWATQLNAALTTIDSHDHTSGKGVQIPAAALNIDGSVDFASNNLTDVATLEVETAITAESADTVDIGTSSTKFNDVYAGSGIFMDSITAPFDANQAVAKQVMNNIHAWAYVTTDGSGNPTLVNDFNIFQCTKPATGEYNFSFSYNSDSQIAYIANVGTNSSGVLGAQIEYISAAQFRIHTINSSNADTDLQSSTLFVAVLGNPFGT